MMNRRAGGRPAEGFRVGGLAKQLGRRGVLRLWLRNHGRGEIELARRLRDQLTMVGVRLGSLLRAAVAKGEVLTEDSVSGMLPSDLTERITKSVRPELHQTAVTGAVAEWRLAVSRRSHGARWKEAIPLPATVGQEIRDWLDALLKEPYWQDVSETVRQDVVNALKDGLDRGESGRELAERIQRVMGPNANSRRAMLIARTEVTGGLNYGHQIARNHLESLGAAIDKEWICVKDVDTRPDHLEANGQVVPNGGQFTVGGEKCDHPGDTKLSAKQRCNCILPGMWVRGKIEAATQSWYAGEVIEVILRSGRRMTLTPNHPVLSAVDGWVKAGDLDCGNYLISYDAQVDLAMRMAAGGDDKYDMPPRIEEVFQSLVAGAISGLGPAVEVSRGEVDDFYGDGPSVNRDINVVWANGKLLGHPKAGRGEQRGDRVLTLELSHAVAESRDRPLSSPLYGVSLATAMFPGSGTLSSYDSFIANHPAPLEEFGLRSVSCLDAGFLKHSRERLAIDSAGIRELLHRNAGLVAADQVVKIRRLEWSGHVYDLQCSDGLIVCNDIILSNCRCACVSKISEDIWDDDGPADVAKPPADPTEPPTVKPPLIDHVVKPKPPALPPVPTPYGDVPGEAVEWKKGSKSSIAAIKKYTGNGYREMNRYLRGDDKNPTSATLKSSKLMNDAIDKTPEFPKPLTVYRGVRMPEESRNKLLASMLDSQKTGKPIEMRGLISTTIKPEVAGGNFSTSNPNTGLIMEIQAKRGIYVYDVSRVKHEHEVVLAHGSQFRVVGVREDKFPPYEQKRTIVTMEQI